MERQRQKSNQDSIYGQNDSREKKDFREEYLVPL